jgi:hypothetical protein
MLLQNVVRRSCGLSGRVSEDRRKHRITQRFLEEIGVQVGSENRRTGLTATGGITIEVVAGSSQVAIKVRVGSAENSG